ncbi:MAG: GGDEF domain-containing protein [candidate division Zixibacteria bacterium]|nr:GGDEF domain-containing protein [candidate division Zixibacteria bacterium]
MRHVAVHLDGPQAEVFLSRILDKKQVSRHYFRSVEDLLTLAQRFSLDLIFIGGSGEDDDPVFGILDTVRAIKTHTYLSIIPTILYHPNPADTTQLAAYESGAEEFYSDAVPISIAKVKTGMLIERAIRDLAVNPSTRLPGPGLIDLEIERQIKMEQQFAVCYADLDNFKAYNDYYGYYYGDRVIRLTARIIKDVVFDLCREGFVGHIGGDDFIFVIPADLVPRICENILRTFDVIIPYRYQTDDRRRGYIVTRNRRGEEENFSLMTLSIAVVVNKGKTFSHVGEMSHMLADLKKYTKSLAGSNYVVERRRKY